MIGRALKEGELEKMMEKGLLDPDVLLPKVGKYFSELARAGGALGIKLNQLETIEMRMKMRWEQIQKTVYETGGESGLKGLYKTLDQIFKMMMDENLVGGGFLKGFLDSATQSLKDIWDLGQKIKIFLMDIGVNNVNGEMFGKAAYWASVAASVQIIAKAIGFIFGGGIVGNMVKLAGGLRGAASAAEAAAGTAGGAAAVAGAGGWWATLGTQITALTAALSPLVAPVVAIAAALGGLSFAQSKYNELTPEQKAAYDLKTSQAGASSGDFYSRKSALEMLGKQNQLPNTNPYSAMIATTAIATYAEKMAQIEQDMKTNAPPIRLDISTNESEFNKLFNIKVDSKMQDFLVKPIIPPYLNPQGSSK